MGIWSIIFHILYLVRIFLHNMGKIWSFCTVWRQNAISWNFLECYKLENEMSSGCVVCPDVYKTKEVPWGELTKWHRYKTCTIILNWEYETDLSSLLFWRMPPTPVSCAIITVQKTLVIPPIEVTQSSYTQDYVTYTVYYTVFC